MTVTPASSVSSNFVRGLQRGCGFRYPGAAYIMAAAVSGGKSIPVIDFLIDPPYQVTREALGLASLGYVVVERNDGSGIKDLFDWVGADYTVASFVEETARYGCTSRRVSDAALKAVLPELTPLVSMHYFLSWSVIPDPSYLYKIMTNVVCPHKHEAHETKVVDVDGCITLHWELLDPLLRVKDELHTFAHPSPKYEVFRYSGNAKPEKLPEDFKLEEGIFMGLPIVQIDVIEDPETNKEKDIAALIENLGNDFPYEIVGE